ncbi:MAG: hypothetical protein LIO53_04815, partial [Oscillospiraceae bacterium]|nr:hypothetical protein [Oscillospiraceae bacterium]
YYESSSVYWYQRTYTYDSTGNMLNQYYENSRGTAYYPRIYTYDNAGNMLTDYYNSSSGYWWKHTYTYDSTGNVLTEYYEDSDGYLEKYTYTYDSNGNMLSEYYEYYEEDSDGYWYKCTYTYILKSSLVLPEQSFTATNDGAVTNGGEKERTVDVIIVSYDDNGYLLDVSSETVKFDAGETIDYDLAENERIFVWNSLKGMYPLTAE